MFSKILSATAVALASSSLVAAQTSSLCNPVKGQKCPDDEAVGSTVTIDFTKGANDFFTVAEGTTLQYDPVKGAAFTISKDTQAPTITSKKYIFFGRVDVTVQASLGTGVVTSSVLQSDDLDEIDWEWLGGDSAQVQTNYFSKGDTTTYDRGGYSPVGNPQSTFHTYSIDWTPQAINWIIDGTTVRTLTYNDAKGGTTFPQTPMQLKLGTWVAGKQGAPPGTVQWAGGYTNFADAPFTGYYKSVTVTDYSNSVKGASAYRYTDTSGTYQNIKVLTGGSDSENVNATSSSAVSKTHSKTASATLTTATKGASNSTATATGSGSGSGSSATPTAGSSSKPTTAATNAGVQSMVSLVAMGAALALSCLVL